MELILNLLTGLLPLAYAASLVAYGRVFFIEKSEGQGAGFASLTFLAALGLHTLLLVLLAATHHRCPLWTQGEALLVMAWLLGLVNLVSEWSAGSRRLGLFTLTPVALISSGALFFLGEELTLGEQYRSAWFIFHIVASLAAYAGFFLSAVLTCLYLVLHRKLKNKEFDVFFRKLPPLDRLDKLSAVWSTLGTGMMLISTGIGITWVRQAGLGGMGAREWSILLVLAAYGSVAAARRLLDWRGQRHARLLLASFILLILVNLLGTHGFRF
jgi:HemX protein